MSYQYVKDPIVIEQNSFQQIRELTELGHFDREQQQVVMRIVHSCGLPEVATQVRFSANACSAVLTALAAGGRILCDVEMVKHGITKRMIAHEPVCLLNDSHTAELAKQSGETRSMAALALWQEQLAGSIVLIGNAPTALYRLLEMVAEGAERPAAVIAMPVGFIGAAESKQALWDDHRSLGLECITLLGRQGGSAITASALNALLRCQRGEWY